MARLTILNSIIL